MKYPPQHHQEAGYDNIIRTLKTFPLATVISVVSNKPVITHLPLIFNPDKNFGKLIGHLDKSNPQVEALKNGQPCTVIFNGPDTYISPSIYTTQQLPTWNYIKVHIEGKVSQITDPDLIKQSMVKMTHFLETPEHNYALEINNPKMDALIKYVVGFEIEITSWEGKFKLSQDKSTTDQNQAKKQLQINYQTIMNEYLDKIYKNHVTITS